MESLRLGVFDFWDSFRATVDIAERAEQLGYSRVWLAEHVVGMDCSAQLPLTLLAGLTGSIRVGTAGVQIRFQDPGLVARGFRFLESLLPGRIDAGFCPGGGNGDPGLNRYETSAALGEDTFGLRASGLLAAMREAAPMPIPWAMGTGIRTAAFAARESIGFPYSVAHQYTPSPGDGEPAVLAAYRSQFTPGPELSEPVSCLLMAVSCADTEHDARRFLELPYPAIFHVSAVGRADQCRDRIERLARLHGCEEVVVLARSPDLPATIRAYELLAEGFELTSEPSSDTP